MTARALPTGFDPDEEERWHDELMVLAELSPLERMRQRVVSGDAIKNVAPPEPLIAGVLDKGATAVLYGRAGSGKSFVALDWVLSVATGSQWFDCAVEQVPVLYVVGEGFAGLGQRVSAWQAARQTWTTGDAHFLPVAVNLFERSATSDLSALMLELRIRFVVLDTLARCTVGAEENSSRDMGQVVGNVDRLRDETGATVLLVHHVGKNRDAGMRGSTAIEAGVDAAIECEGDDEHIVLTDPRQKHHASGQLREHFRLAPFGASCALERASGTPTTLTERTRAVLTTLAEVDDGRGVASSVWLESVPNGVAPRTFHRAKKNLLYAGYCHNIGTEKQPRYALSENGREAIGCHGADEVPIGAMAPGQLGAMVPPPLRGGTSGSDSATTAGNAR